MGYGSIFGHAKANPNAPEAFAICDRCGRGWNHKDLRWQFDWRGASLTNLRILVCQPCYDKPQEQLRAIVLSADPVPIQNSRMPNFQYEETNTRVISGPNFQNLVIGLSVPEAPVSRATQLNNTRVTQTTGEPPFGLSEEPGTEPFFPNPDDIGVPYGFEVDPPESVSDVPNTGPLT